MGRPFLSTPALSACCVRSEATYWGALVLLVQALQSKILLFAASSRYTLRGRIKKRAEKYISSFPCAAHERDLSSEMRSDKAESRAAHIEVKSHEPTTTQNLGDGSDTLMVILRRDWKAALWAVFFSLSIIMDGYDLQLVYSLLALPQFEEKYGQPYGTGYQLTANWQTALNIGSPIGRVVGGLLVAWLSDRFSRKSILAMSLLLTSGCIFFTVFATTIQILVAGEMIIGVLWGCFNTLAPVYTSEICPVALRGILMAFILTSWGIGQLIAQGVIKACSERQDNWSFRIPFAIQWLWPVMMLALLPFAPESPWWLIRQGQLEGARASLRKVSNESDEMLNNRLVEMIATNELEIENATGTRFADCFTGTDLRRTEIVAMAWAIQALCGNSFQGYGIYFLELAGFPLSLAFSLGVAQSGISVFASILSWALISFFGRRTIFVLGLLALTLIMFLIAILDVVPGYNTRDSIQYTQGSLLIVWAFLFFLTVASVSYIIVGETSATRLRDKTTAIGSMVYSAVGVGFGFSTPAMLNPTALNWRGKTGFWFGSLSLLCLIWAWLRLPECKHRSYQELDALFDARVATRKFKHFELGPVAPTSAESKALPPATGSE